jgi:HEAT repeat protein
MATTKLNIAELVEQMPETDGDILAKKQAAEPQNTDENDKKKKVVKYGEASKFTGPDPEAAAKIFEDILGGGRPSLVELIELLRDPSEPDFKNYKAAYVMHGLDIYVGRPGQEERKRWFAEVLAAALTPNIKADIAVHSAGVKAFLIRELQVIGGAEAVNALAGQLQDDQLCEPATQALLAIRQGVTGAFEKALGSAKGKNRVTIIQALGVLRDAGSVQALTVSLGNDDANVRIAAAWALANIPSPNSWQALLKMADGSENWERIQATKSCFLLAEKTAASGDKAIAKNIYTHLRDTRKDKSEEYIRAIAEKSLAAL